MQANNPSYRCFTKAIKQDDTSPTYSWRWIGAKRGWFKVYEDRVECGLWRIAFKEIKTATVFRTQQWFIPVTVLRIVTQDGGYQFGFNPWSDPMPHLNIPTEEQKVRLKYSTFSIAIRIAALIAILWLIFK